MTLISKEDAIEAIASRDETDGTVKVFTGRQVNGILSALPSAEAEWIPREHFDVLKKNYDMLAGLLEEAKARAIGAWIPCSERLPSELEAVTVTWVNHNPPVYYQHIKDIPQTDTAVWYNGNWYWWDATVIDLLGEHGGAYIHGIEPIDKDIEVVAWMPLPEPYKAESEVEGWT